MLHSLRLTLYTWLQALFAAYRRLDLHLGQRFPWLRRVYAALAATLRPPRVNIQGQWVYLHPEDIGLSHDLLYGGSYEHFETTLFTAALEPGMTVLDIGANVGMYTMLAAARVGPTGRVYAFEPERENFALLTKNIAANKHTNVVPMQYAVGESDGEIPVYLAKDNRGDHRTYAPDDGFAREHYLVRLVALDHSLPPGVTPSVIKMDIQGFEMYALRGMTETLRQAERLALYTEFWPYGLAGAGVTAPAQYIEAVKALGFHVYQIDAASQALLEVPDAQALVASLSGQSYADLLCLKGEWPQLTRFLRVQERETQ